MPISVSIGVTSTFNSRQPSGPGPDKVPHRIKRDAGIAVLRNSLWAILLLPAVLLAIQREVIGREERYLERTFGEEYLDYKASVRRWV
jgi:hypothetical protein